MVESRPAEPPVEIVDLAGPDREAAIPILREAFVGILRWHAKRLLGELSLVRAARAGGAIVGVTLLEQLEPEVGFVHYVAVLGSHRRRGIGGRLVDDAIALFAAGGAEVVYASVEEENLASRELFLSRGFRVTERQERSFRDGGLGAWGLRSRMRVQRGEILFGRRIRPAGPPRAGAVGAPTEGGAP